MSNVDRVTRRRRWWALIVLALLLFGLAIPLGLWVLREACRQMRAWDGEFPACAGLMINVNISARQCLDPGLVAVSYG